jgi:hypothetical protein
MLVDACWFVVCGAGLAALRAVKLACCNIAEAARITQRAHAIFS